MSSLFDTLGVDWDADERTIKRAYAKLIKEFRPDSHPSEFARIRAAYENALDNLRNRERWQVFEVQEDSEQQEQDDHQESYLELQAAERQSDAIKAAQEFEATYIEPETQVIPSYQRMPRINNPELAEQQSEQDELLSNNEIVPPYRRILSETLTELDDDETLEEYHLPEIQYEFSADSLISEVLADDEYQAYDDVVKEFLARLADFSLPKDELATLTCFEEHIQQLDVMSLDQRMDYEDGLCHWLLNSHQPSLLVFLAACKRFDWNEFHLHNIQHHFGQQGKVRFSNLLKLASFYNEIIESDSALLKDESKTKWEFLRLKTRVDALDRKAKLAQWKEDCLNADLPGLQSYFEEYVEKRFQIFAVDIFFSLSLTIFAWWICTQPELITSLNLWMRIGISTATGVMFLVLPVVLRVLNGLIQEKPSSVICKAVDWINGSGLATFFAVAIILAIAIAAFPDQVVILMSIFGLYLATFPIVAVYNFLAKFEKLIANIWWFLVDTLLLLERTAADITPNPYLKFIMRIVLYVSVPVLLLKEYLPEMTAFVRKALSSKVLKGFVMAILLFIVIMVLVIYKDVAEQKKKIYEYKQTQSEHVLEHVKKKEQVLPKQEIQRVE